MHSCTRCFPVVRLCLAFIFASAAAASAQIPIPQGFPSAGTTGLAGVGLTVDDLSPMLGGNINTEGAVIEMKDIIGTINIKANNVTIRKCRVSNYQYMAIRIYDGFIGTVIEDCLLPGSQGTVGVIGHNYTLRRCDISGDHDGIKIGDRSLIEDNYIHDQFKDADSHNDAMQASYTTRDTIIRHNTLKGPYKLSTSAIKITPELGPDPVIDNILFENNFLSGGSITVYCTTKDNGPPTNVTFRNNVWEKNSWLYNYLRYEGTPTFEGNIYHTGEAIYANPAVPNNAPVADCGSNITATAPAGQQEAEVSLDASASTDADGHTMYYSWLIGGTEIAQGINPAVSLPVGTHTITLNVRDERFASSTDTLNVIVTAATAIGGDADLDGDVDIYDFLILKANYGTQSGATWQQGDFDANGKVDIFDFLILKANYGA